MEEDMKHTGALLEPEVVNLVGHLDVPKQI